jgi:hypothetical protein
MYQRLVLRILVLVILLAGSLSAFAQTITIFDVPGSTDTQPLAINSKGQITGSYVDALGKHGFLRQPDGTLISFDAPLNGRVQTIPTSMNTAGEIAGYVFSLDTFLDYAFARGKDGSFVIFDEPDACRSQRMLGSVNQATWGPLQAIGRVEGIAATGISNRGDITGICGPAPPFNRSFLRQRNGQVAVFSVPVKGPSITLAQAINCHGQIAGSFYDAGENGAYLGFLRQSDGTISTFGHPYSDVRPVALTSAGWIIGTADGHGFVLRSGGRLGIFDVANSVSTQPNAISSAGRIAGAYLDAANAYHGFIRELDGEITVFDVPGSTSTYPVGMDSRGDVAGWYSDASGIHGFIRSE